MVRNLFYVPTNHIHQFWHLAEHHLQRAIETAHGEFTIDQLKQYASLGNCCLFLIMDEDNKCHGAITGQWTIYPNDRVFYITYLGGNGVTDTWDQVKQWVHNNGGTVIQGSTGKKSLIKLYERLDFNQKYTLMEYKL